MQCQALRNIPRLKLDLALADLESEEDVRLRAVKKKALHRYFEANIPVKYWNLEMRRDFTGDKALLQYYEKLTEDLSGMYKRGVAVCFAGNFGIGKMIDLQTELPTPNGFVKLIDLKEGDQLFDENGSICNIVKLHPVNLLPESYRVTFDDGSFVDACRDHLWQTYTYKDRDNRHRSKLKKHKPWLEKENGKIPTPTIKSTLDILETLKHNGFSNHSIVCCKPLQTNESNLLINPYVLGVWLGDGSSNCGMIECADKQILDEINKIGYSCNKKESSVRETSKSCAYRIGDFIKENGTRYIRLTYELKQLGLLNNKHIPKDYMFSSINQRLSLLQGLMDSDGSCSSIGLCEFVSVNETLAKNVHELLLSLGIKSFINKNKTTLDGKACKDRFRVTFTTREKVFRLNRKNKNIKPIGAQINRTKHRYIVNVERIDPKPMRCITVDSPSHLFLVTRHCIPTHNTMLVTNVLKRALEKGHCGLFVNLNDIISAQKSNEQFQARQELLRTDFLVVDEFDPRYMASTQASTDFYGRVLEDVLRNRTQNRLPILMCTNSPNPNLSFEGALQQSISSLFNYVDLVPSLGEDYRPKEGKHE